MSCPDYMGTWGNKDPEEKKEYGINWVDDMAEGTTVSSSVWTVVSGDVTLSDEDIGGTIVKVKVAGGVDGTRVLVKNHSICSNGDELEGTMMLDIRNR